MSTNIIHSLIVKIIRGITPQKNWSPCALTIGNFDGVHRGHQALLKELTSEAKSLGIPSCVMTFEPHPIEYFAPDKAPSRLLNLRDKAAALSALGIDYMILVHFNETFSKFSAKEFESQILHKQLLVKSLFIGDDFQYGSQRLGNFSSLVKAGHELGYKVQNIHTVSEGDLRISSSAIRQAIAAGDMEFASQLLGRPYTISGHVIHGEKLGRNLGFPTLNISVANRFHKRQPAASGIFIARVHGLGDKPYQAVASLGKRPTVDDSGRYLLEAHVFDFDEYVYGKLIQVELIKKIRDEEKYADLHALEAAIGSDAKVAKEFFTKPL